MDKYNILKLENQLCFRLYASSREVIKKYKPILDQYNLTYTQYLTMLVLWENEKITVKGIGENGCGCSNEPWYVCYYRLACIR